MFITTFLWALNNNTRTFAMVYSRFLACYPLRRPNSTLATFPCVKGIKKVCPCAQGPLLGILPHKKAGISLEGSQWPGSLVGHACWAALPSPLYMPLSSLGHGGNSICLDLTPCLLTFWTRNKIFRGIYTIDQIKYLHWKQWVITVITKELFLPKFILIRIEFFSTWIIKRYARDPRNEKWK